MRPATRFVDLLEVPVLGREEDAADLFSAYIMLHFGKDDARRLIFGSAYQYKADLQNPEVSFELKKFSDEHGFQAQRFSMCYVSHMVLIRNYLLMLWRKDICQKPELRVVMANMSSLLLHSRS